MKKECSKEKRNRILFSLISFAMCIAVISSFIFISTDIFDAKGIMEYDKEKDCVCVRFGAFSSDVPHALRYDLDKYIVEYAKNHERTVVVCQIKRFRIPTGEFGIHFGSSSYAIEKVTITDESPDDFNFF